MTVLDHYSIFLAVVAVVCVVLLVRTLRRRWQPKASASPRARTRHEPARKAVVDNIAKISPLLPQLLTEKINGRQWHDTVTAIGNDELSAYAKRAKSNSRMWLRIMQMWGIEPDRRSVFTATDEHTLMYRTTDGRLVEIGCRYIVKDPAWVLKDSTGRSPIHIGSAIAVKIT